MEKDDNVREIDFGTNIDLGAIPAKSSYLKANQCKEIGSGCTRILDVLVKENKDNDPKINIIIKSGLVEYKLSFNRVKNVYKYSVNLQNLWFDHEKILYGGCLVKSIDAKDLEYVGEANIKEWSKTINKIQKKFIKPQFIITGHHSWGSTKTLEHTLKLIKQHEENNIH
jgi:hypothetical protein